MHRGMLTFTDEQVEWLPERIPGPWRDPRGGRLPAYKRLPLGAS